MRADHGAMKLTTPKRRRRAFIESYEFPMALKNKIRDELDGDRPVNVALEGLREWYLACLEAGPEATLGMPSRAVDVAWHEMILMTRTYHHFCERAFGYYLHHSPEAVMDAPMRDGLARTLAVVERNRALTMAGIPMLFAIDSELDLVGGQSWAEARHRLAARPPALPRPRRRPRVVRRRLRRRLLDRRRRWAVAAAAVVAAAAAAVRPPRARRRRTPARGVRTRAG